MLEEVFNYAEAILWWCFGLGSLICSFVKEKRWRRLFLGLAVAFGGFGASDWIEVKTGAWWDPWWLLVLKGVSLLAIIALLRALWPALKPRPAAR